MKTGAGLVLLCVLGAVLYGVLHDQLTARICPEYFTIGHVTPGFVGPTPTALGLYWGVVATWWVGALIGVPLALAMRAGPLPELGARWLAPKLSGVLAGMLALAMTGLMLALFAETAGVLPPAWKEAVPDRVPEVQRARFIANALAHNLSYGAGFLGGVWLWCAALIARIGLHRHAGAIQSSP